MFKPTRLQLMKWHALLACFFLPLSILFFISGALYFLDIKGDVQKNDFSVVLEQPFSADLEISTGIVSDILYDRGIPQPKGEPSMLIKKNLYIFNWSDLEHSLKVTARKNANAVKVILEERSLLAQIMYFHTANAGDVFKVSALLMVTALLFILSTGVFMAQSMPALRKPSWLSLVLGTSAVILLITLN